MRVTDLIPDIHRLRALWAPAKRACRVACSVLTVAALTTVAACGDSSTDGDPEGVTLRFALWSNSEAHLAMLEGFADEFSRNHPGVSTEFIPIPGADYLTKVTVALAGGRPFDAGWLGEGDVAAMTASGALADLAPAIAADDEYELADFTTKSLNNWVDGDQIYGLPFSTSPFLTYFNADLFEQAGLERPDQLAARGEWTWLALRDAAREITQAAGSGHYGFEGQDGTIYENPLSFWNTAVPAIRAHGGAVWDPETGTCGLADDATVQAVELLRTMVFEDSSMVPPGQQADFFSGQAAMTINQLSRASILVEAPFEWGVAALPSGPAGAPSFYGQAGLVAFAASEHEELAAELVTFMTQRANVETMAEFFPPARASVLSSQAFLTANPAFTEDQMRSIGEQVLEGESFPFVERFAEVNAALQPELDKLWSPRADTRDVLAGACEVAAPLLVTQ